MSVLAGAGLIGARSKRIIALGCHPPRALLSQGCVWPDQQRLLQTFTTLPRRHLYALNYKYYQHHFRTLISLPGLTCGVQSLPARITLEHGHGLRCVLPVFEQATKPYTNANNNVAAACPKKGVLESAVGGQGESPEAIVLYRPKCRVYTRLERLRRPKAYARRVPCSHIPQQ